MQKHTQTIVIALLAFILFFTINVIGNSSFNKYDLDLTEDKIFDLSDGTKNILQTIRQPVTLRFFYSRSVSNGYPLVKSYAERIRGILQKYVAASGGMLKLQIIDPKAFTDEEDLAVAYGIKGVDLNKEGDKLYLGLAVSNATDDTSAIAFFHPERQRFVEYEITKTIYDLLNRARPKIGLLTSIPMESGPMLGIPGLGGGQGWLILEQLRQSYDIVNITPEMLNIPDVDLLMVVQPKDLSLHLLVAIDQYVLSGGKAVFFADPNKEGMGTGNPEDRRFSAEFNQLLNAWGVSIDPGIIVADRQAARPVQSDSEASGKVDYIAWLSLGKDNLNNEDITTSLLKNVNMATAGAVMDLQKPGLNITPLIHTGMQSMRLPVASIGTAPDPNAMLRNFVSDNKQYTLAARISGKAKTAFPGHGGNGWLEESKGDINIIVVADTDILRDDTWAQVQDMQGYKIVMPNGDNNSFITNIADLMSGSSELISLRGRGAAARPFTVVENIKHNAEEKFLVKEKELKDQLAVTENRLAELKKQAEAEAGNQLAFQSQQQEEISAFSNQMVRIKKELRNVQHELKKDVDRLGGLLKFLNIILVPLLVIKLAVFIFVVRRRGSF